MYVFRYFICHICKHIIQTTRVLNVCSAHIHICSLYSFHKEGKRLGFRRATKKEQRVKLLEATLLSTTMQSMMIMMMMLTENKRETIIFLYRIPRCTSVKSRVETTTE